MPDSEPQSESSPPSRSSRLATYIAIGLVLTTLTLLLIPAVLSYRFRGHIGQQLGAGRQLYLALRNHADDTNGPYPLYTNAANKTEMVETSSEAFELILPRYLDDKGPLFNKHSAWCDRSVMDPPYAHKILPGENDWCYVRGLRDDSPAKWPLLANAFAPGTTQYVKDRAKPGGVWKGTWAVLVWASGSAEIVKTRQDRETFFVEREDKPGANAFEKAEDWLMGENVELLYPIPPE